MEGVKGVVDVVGPQQGGPEATWQVDPVAAGRAGLTVEQVPNQLAAAWSGAERHGPAPARPQRSGARALSRRRPLRSRAPGRPRPCARPDGRLVPLSSVARPMVSTGDGELTRENLRQMALVTGAPGEPRPGQRGAEIQTPRRQAQAAGRLHLRGRRAVRVAAPGLPRAAARLRHRRRAGVRSSWSFSSAPSPPSLILLLAAPLSLGGAFLLLLLDRHGAQRLLRDGPDPARRPRR